MNHVRVVRRVVLTTSLVVLAAYLLDKPSLYCMHTGYGCPVADRFGYRYDWVLCVLSCPNTWYAMAAAVLLVLIVERVTKPTTTDEA
jgi:hypothetical protein